MSCIIRVVNTGGLNSGKWYVIDAPSFPVNIEWSLTEGGPYTEDAYDENDPLHPDCENDIYVRLPEGALYGDYIFRYVPTCGSLEDCEDVCVTCADFTITHLSVPEPLSFEICQGEGAQNLFTLADLACAIYDVDYAAGSDEDVDFQLGGTCGSGKGDFLPANITPGTYIFEFSIPGSDCEDCIVEMTVEIIAAVDTSTVEDIVCL